MPHVLLDKELFQNAHNKTGNGYEDFVRKSQDAQIAGSIAMLRSEIARIADAINYCLIDGKQYSEKQIAMADYLAKQKVIVPIATYFRTKVATGPINVWLIRKELRRWGFVPEQMDISIKKRRRLLGGTCYLEITFKKK